VRVHAGAVLGHDRLGHKRRVDAVARCYLLDDRLVGLDLVGHLQGGIKAQIDLVLGDAYLVVGVLDLYVERLQRHHRLAPQGRAASSVVRSK
jgi:hypothetical protein